MSKETVFLADSSYAIRKITEGKFTDEPNYSLKTFKSGQEMRKELLEQRPHVVMVELKLPEWDGYEACRFINSEPSLKNTHVILLRAAFDPVEEEKLHGLKYVDIITKPFDHAMLIEKIEKLPTAAPISQPPPAPQPSQVKAKSQPDLDLPENFPEIDDFDAPSGDISFSDIKKEIDNEEEELPPSIREYYKTPVPRTYEPMGDDVQPSEEVTQGSIPTSRDPLSPTPQFDEIDNPFDDDSIKNQIKEQERELGIGSITEEALAIEQAISKHDRNEFEVDDASDEIDIDGHPMSEEADKNGDTSEVSTSSLDEVETGDEFRDFSFDDKDTLNFPSDPDEPEAMDKVELDGLDNDEFSVSDAEEIDSYERPNVPSFLDLTTSPGKQELEDDEPQLDNAEPEFEIEEGNNWTIPPVQVSKDKDYEISSQEIELSLDPETDQREPSESQEGLINFAPEIDKDEEVEESSRFDDFPGIDDPSDEESYNFSVTPQPDNARTSESDSPNGLSEKEAESSGEIYPLDNPAEAESPPQAASTSPQTEPVSLETLSATDREIIMQRLEANISNNLKEILWDIIPPIAERIIKEEIDTIKKEIAQSIE